VLLEKHIEKKKAFVFGLDNVIYPEKDYLLQVYYLFSEFIAYSEQIDATQIIAFMNAEYSANGVIQLFKKTANQFNIPEKYEENFLTLHHTARLPLKLLLYKDVLSFMQKIVAQEKQLFLLVDGNPLQQINKIKQMEWNGLGNYLKVYFTEEFQAKPSTEALDFLLNEHQLQKEDVLLIGNSLQDETWAKNIAVDYFSVTKLL
jgi:FMN phosphatase YigB (HAD superfamily)